MNGLSINSPAETAMVQLTINGQELAVPVGTTILDAARKAHIEIPTLCHFEDQSIKAVCRICVVEVDGQNLLPASCCTPVSAGMVVKTASPKVLKARKNILELILSRHPQNCLTCPKNGTCQLQKISADLNMSQSSRYEQELKDQKKDQSSPSITRDMSKCILCGRCEEVCSDIQQVCVMAKENRGFHTSVVPPYGRLLRDTTCVNCGQCVQVCPVGALAIHDDTEKIYDNLAQGKKLVIQVAPSVRVTLAEALGEPAGTVSTGRLVTALKKLGFYRVFDSDFTADLTIMEEGNELLHRINNGGVLPMITSCCPAWVKYCETYAHDHLDHLSTAKSPQQMFGALIKTYFAKMDGLDPDEICSISVMPCTAKKFECEREEMNDSGCRDVDISITVQELARLIRAGGIHFSELEETPFDQPFGLGSGAGEIFGATGGVMEAALRTVYEVSTGTPLNKLEFEVVRGFEGVKEASVEIAGLTVKAAVAHGLGNAKKLLDSVREGTADYHFIEIMACPGGCIGGGGNAPKTWKIVKERARSVYEIDQDMPLRKSHENPAIKKIYAEFLGEPLGHTSHRLLHTTYINRQDLLN